MADESVSEEVAPEEVAEQPEVAEEFIDVEGDLVDNSVEEVEEEAPEEAPEVAEEEPEAPEVEEPVEPEVIPEAETVPEVVPAVPEAVDPGDFQPQKDYAFEVTTTDGKTIKLANLAEVDAFAQRLDNEEGLISASQFARFAREAAKMDAGIDRERSEWQSSKEKFEEQQAQQTVRDEQVRQWSNEVKYLEAKGLIPKIDSSKDADWLGNATDEAVKARLDIFKWMDTENQARRSAGIAEVSSAVDAFRMMQAEQAETAASDERGREGEERRAKGAMVGGNRPHVVSNTPKNSIVGEGGTLNDLVYEAQMSL